MASDRAAGWLDTELAHAEQGLLTRDKGSSAAGTSTQMAFQNRYQPLSFKPQPAALASEKVYFRFRANFSVPLPNTRPLPWNSACKVSVLPSRVASRVILLPSDFTTL